ncbi:rCG64285, partial [Rattus norvegicus]
MQEVDRQRALQQRMEMEQHGLMGAELANRTPVSQMPFYASDRPCDFLQPPRPLQQSPQHQQQIGPVLPQQTVQQGSVNSPPNQTFMQTNERRQVGPTPFVPDSPSASGGSPNFHSVKQGHGNLSGSSFQQSPLRPPFTPILPGKPPVANSSVPCGQDPAVTAQGQNFSGSSQSLIQLYSDIIPEEKGKNKRTRKKKKDDDAESSKAPSTPHSNCTAPPTPGLSETTSAPEVSTPSELPQQRQQEAEAVESVRVPTPNVATGQPCIESENKLPSSEFIKETSSQQTPVSSEADKPSGEASNKSEERKLETAEIQPCPSQVDTKVEEKTGSKIKDTAAGPVSSIQCPSNPARTPVTKGNTGNELLKHLLKNKKASSLLTQKPEGTLSSDESSTQDGKLVEKQNPAEGLQTLGAQMQGGFGGGNSQLPKTDGGSETKKQRSKRTQRTGEKAAPRS